MLFIFIEIFPKDIIRRLLQCGIKITVSGPSNIRCICTLACMYAILFLLYSLFILSLKFVNLLHILVLHHLIECLSVIIVATITRCYIIIPWRLRWMLLMLAGSTPGPVIFCNWRQFLKLGWLFRIFSFLNFRGCIHQIVSILCNIVWFKLHIRLVVAVWMLQWLLRDWRAHIIIPNGVRHLPSFPLLI